MIQNSDIIVAETKDAVLVLIIGQCRWVSKLDDVDSILDSDFFDSVGVPEAQIVFGEESGDSSVTWMRSDISNFNKQGDPIVGGRTLGVGCLEVLSADVVLSIADVNQNVELIVSVSGQSLVVQFIN